MDIIEKIKTNVRIETLLHDLGYKTNKTRWIWDKDHFSDGWTYSIQKNMVKDHNESKNRPQGNPYHFYMMHSGSTHEEAIAFFKKQYNIIDTDQPMQTSQYHSPEIKPIKEYKLLNDIDKIKSFLGSRGIDYDKLPKGFVTLVHGQVYGKDAPSVSTDCIQAPMRLDNQLSGYQMRSIKGKGFYTNGTDGLFYSFDKNLKNDYIILVEGLTDTLAVRQYTQQVIGFKSASTGISPYMVAFISKFKKIYICFDNDNAGIKARDKISEQIDGNIYTFSELSESEDINDFIKDLGEESITHILESSAPLKEKVFEHISYEEGLQKGYKEFSSRDANSVISYGFQKFDEHLGFILPGQLIVVGGVTGAGKSTLVNQIGNNVASQGFTVARYSLEDRLEETRINEIYYEVCRMRAKRKEPIPEHYKFEANMCTEQDFPGLQFDIEQSVKNLNKYNKNIIDLSNKSMVGIEELENLLKDVVINKQVRLIIIDHLHYVKFEKSQRHDLAIEDFMHQLNNLLRKYHVSCILVSHYRKLQKDEDPSNDSFKDGSAIAQVANKVIHITKTDEFEEIPEDDKEFIIKGSQKTKYHITKNRGKSWLGMIYGAFYNGRIILKESELQKSRKFSKIKHKEATASDLESLFG